MSTRPSWDDYFLKVAQDISERSTCDRGKPGCVFVLDNQVLATGYAGSPPGFPHCDEVGHQMEERVRFILSEPILEAKLPREEKVKEITDNLGTSNYGWNSEQDRFEKDPTQHCCRTIHAEMNAILQAAKRGIALNGSTLYVSMTPCRNCTMALISVGVKRVVCAKKYHAGSESEEMFSQAGIPIEFKNEDTVQYTNQKTEVS